MRHLRLIISMGLLAILLPFAYTLTRAAASPHTSYLPVAVNNASGSVTFGGYLRSCDTQHWATEFYFTMTSANGWPINLNQLPGGPYAVVYSHTPDGTILGQTTESGSVTLSQELIDADWHVWIINSTNQRVSDIVSFHSDSELGLGNCQDFGVTFFDPAFIATPVPTPPVHPSATPNPP